MKKNATNKELKIKDLFNLAERTNEGAYVTTLENGNKYCFGYYDGTETREDVFNVVKRAERRVTASMNHKYINIFEDQQNKMLLFWKDNLNKVESVKNAAEKLTRLEEREDKLQNLYNSMLRGATYTDEYFKYSDIRKEIENTIKQERKKIQNVTKRYLRRLGLNIPVLNYCTVKQLYNALPANWEEMAKRGIKSVNTDLLPHVRDQKEPIKLEPTMVEPETIAEPTMVEPETIEEPTMVEPETIAEPTMVEPETIEEPTITHTLHMWIMSTAAAAVACLIVFISLSIKPHTAATAATAAPTVATISEPTMVEPTMVEPTMVECEPIDHINEVICTGSIDPYIEHVKEEITAYYRECRESQLQELAELATVDDTELIAAIETTETATEAAECVPTVETITDTENTPESVEIMPTETDTESDTGTVSDTDNIDYNSSDYVELSVTTIDTNGDPVVNVYFVPLNE